MALAPQVAQFLAEWARLQVPDFCQLPAEEVPARRQQMIAAARLSPTVPRRVRVLDQWIERRDHPLRIRLYWPDAAPHHPEGWPVCLYFHGGGWVLNSIETHDDVVRRLTESSGCMFVSVDYRLAPEHPYPAATDDAWAALLWVASAGKKWGMDVRRIGVAGDSSGGNLAAALAQRTRDQNGPALRAQALAYPVIDCDFDRPSYGQNAEGYFLTKAEMQWFWDQYAPGERRLEPYASPIRAKSLSDLPKALVISAEYDPLRDEAEAYAIALAQAGVETTFYRVPGMIHAFLRRIDVFDASRDAIRAIGHFLAQGLA